MSKTAFALLLCSSALLPAAAIAQDNDPPIRSFGYVAYTVTDVPKYAAAVGATAPVGPLDLAGMIYVNRDGEYQTSGVKYLYAQKEFTFSQEEDPLSIGVRVGRVRHMLGFNNLKRDNPQVADFVWHPPAIYREHAAHMASSGDGAQLYAKGHAGHFPIGLTLTHVKPVLKPMDESVAILFGDPRVGTFGSGSRITGLNATISSPTGVVQIRYDYTLLDMEFVPSRMTASFLRGGMTRTALHTIGARAYLTDDFDVTVERIQVRNQGNEVWDTFHRAWPVRGSPGGWALTLRYRPTGVDQIALSLDRWCTDESDCSGSRGDAVGIPRHAYYSRSASIAYRRQLDKNWTVTAQASAIRGSNTVSVTREKDERNDRLGIQFSYVW